MANHKSAEKRHRQSLKRRNRNRMVKSSVRTALSKAYDDLKETSSCRKAESSLAKAAAKGVLHKKTAARKASRLAKAANKAKKH